MPTDSLPPADVFRIGRLSLDGADTAHFVNKLGISADQVERARDVCAKALSEALAELDGRDYHLMAPDELQTRTDECLRLLLYWEERNRLPDWGPHTAGGDADGDDIDPAASAE